MKLNLFTFAAALLLATGSAQGQENDKNYCGYRGYSPWLSWYQAHKAELAQQRADNDTTWLYVPVTVHIVGNNSGTGHYRTDQAIRALCEMNAYYAPTYIRFYLLPEEPFQFYNDSYWYQHDWEGGSDMAFTILPGRENRLNICVVDDPAGNCGYSGWDVIVLAKDCSGPGYSTWSHEAGHHFSLPHTFYGWEVASDYDYSQPAPEDWDGWPVERVDGSNCFFAGDGFCDTRPDYLNYRWNCDLNSESVEVQHDPDGVPFQSDGTLLMSYADQACRVRFSDEQTEAMRQNLFNEHFLYLQEFEAGPQIADDAAVQLLSPVDSQVVQYNDFTVSWAPVPNARHYHVQVGMTPNYSIILVNKTVTDETSITFTTGIPNNRTLYWRVRAYGDWDFCQPDNYTTGIFKTSNLQSSASALEQSLTAELAPNPAAGGLPASLVVSTDESQDAQLRVTDAAGRLCQQRQTRLLPGENRLEIPTDALLPGLYWIALQNEKGRLVRRLAVTD